ncbi:Retrovirus-related Pol polyprotein from transposon opus [Folsomia candida]|uniref:Retrovirus-related Pol polyprotein from transposon opus n=1 Tax=Folsomia candida TaxID=158441 RepID=A0A226DXH1_FOLCA|nr:Retrovirus-related Pol polyprotein from transposon opus [Folsomia candida]
MPLWNFFSRRTDPSPPPSDLLEAPESVFVSGRRFSHLRDPIDPDSDREHQIVSPTDSSQCGVVTDDFGYTNSDPLPLSHLPSAPDPDHSASSILPGNINDNLLNNQVRPPSVTFIRENQPVNFVPTPEPSRPPNPPPPPPANTFFFGPRALNPDAVFRFPSSPSPFIRPPPPNRPPVPPPTPAAATANMAARNFFTGSPPQPAPLVNINLEMPKYGHELSKLGLRLFIQRFLRWAEAKRLTVPQAKLTLPLAFSNATAQHYFMINFAEQDNPAIEWATFINNFLTKCPMEVDDHTSVLDLLKSPKPKLEKASVYLQRLRAVMSEEYTGHAEPDIIRLLMDNLDPSLRQFLECKGPPLTYGDLVSLVKHYEDRGLQKTLTPQLQPPAPVTPLAPPTAQPKPVNNATDGGLSLGVNLTNVKNMQGVLNHLSDLQAAIMRLNVSPSQNHGSRSRPDQSQDNRAPRPNGQRPSFECYYCGIRGHRIIECRKKMLAFNLTTKGVVAMAPGPLCTAAITAAVTTLLVTTAVAMTTVTTVAEMTPPTMSVAIQTFSRAAVVNLPVAVTTSIIILRIVTTRDAKTISGMSVQRVPLPPLKSILRPSSPSLDPAGPRHVTFNQNTIDLRINLQDFSANHGPVTIDTFINNQRITATVDNGAKASIITEALAVGLPRINPNLPYRLSDFGNHTIRDCGLVILPLKIADSLDTTGTTPSPKPLLPSLTISPAASGPSPPPPPPLPSALLSPPPAALSPPPVAAAELSPPPFLMDLTKLKINPNISPSTRAKLLSLITEFKHIFSWDPTKLGRTDRVEFDIDNGDHPPIRMQQFNHSEKIHRDIKSHVDKLLAQGIVRPIRGSWSSPCFFVPKKDDDDNLNSQRFTVDYRSLNRITKKIQWPQTRIDDIFQSLRGKKYFTSLDFTSGYYQVPMTPDAQEKATFVTREGTFAPTVLPFGVSNGPARFAELLDEVLSGLKGEVCQNFFDDIVSAGATEEEALEKLRLIFERIAAEGLNLKPYKCDFLQAK